MQTKYLCVLIHISIKGQGWRCETGLNPLVKVFLLTVPRRVFCGSFLLVILHVGVWCAVESVSL